MLFLQNIKFTNTMVTCYTRNYGPVMLNKVNRMDCRGFSDRKLKPYVGLPYSYSFGRSGKQLQYLTIGDLIRKRAETDKDRIAFVSEYENISKTFFEVNEDSNKLSKGLYDLGLRRGDVVGLWSCNSYSWIQTQYACAKLGLILCTVNPVYKGPELNYALRMGQIKAMFMPGEGSVQEQVNNFKKVFNETFEINKDLESGEILLKDVIFMDGKNLTNRTKYDFNYHSFESLLSNDGKVDKSILSQVSPDDPAMIMFTSGTTGKPKGAYLSHFTLVIANFKYDVKLIIEAMNKHQCTHIVATPTLIIDIMAYLERNKVQMSFLRGAFLAGAPVPIEVAHRISKVIPSVDDVRIGYGATELGPTVTGTHKADTFEQRTESVGSALDFIEVKIVDPISGKICKIGETGELLSRGHNVMIGYWRDEQKTKEAIDETKWYRSGDLAVMDEQGYFKIIGRTKEMIIRGGENIYPREVEEVLHTHPQVFDAYVIGVPDQRTGEEVCAWIQLKDKNTNLSAEDIKEYCKDKISYFKIPRYVLFVEDFPLTPTGKAKKFLMRAKSCEIFGLKENK